MKIFISWSGELSKKVAFSLKTWLKSMIHTVEPYVSSEDISKGVRWSSNVAKELESSAFGILCVTKDNLQSAWLNFEAGALSKVVNASVVAPFLLDVRSSEIAGPLSQFQHTEFEREDIRKLIGSVNEALPTPLNEKLLDRTFEKWYEDLHTELLEILGESAPGKSSTEHEVQVENRELEEILNLSRSNQKLLQQPEILLPQDYLVPILESVINRSKVVNGSDKVFQQASAIGLDRVTMSRHHALREFLHNIDREEREIIVVGSSLKGFFRSHEKMKERFEFKQKVGTRIKFLLMHPYFADLRARQEDRRSSDIGQEVIQSLRTLEGMGTPVQCVRLYKGAPTVFCIRTGSALLLNPYTYEAEAFQAPCFTFSSDGPLYDAYTQYHLDLWDSYNTMSLSGWQDVNALEAGVPKSVEIINALYNLSDDRIEVASD